MAPKKPKSRATNKKKKTKSYQFSGSSSNEPDNNAIQENPQVEQPLEIAPGKGRNKAISIKVKFEHGRNLNYSIVGNIVHLEFQNSKIQPKKGAAMKRKSATDKLDTERKLLVHKNVLDIYNTYNIGKTTFYVMELIQYSLHEYITLNFNRILRKSSRRGSTVFIGGPVLQEIVRQLLDVMSFVHDEHYSLGFLSLHNVFVVNKNALSPIVKIDLKVQKGGTISSRKNDWACLGGLLKKLKTTCTIMVRLDRGMDHLDTSDLDDVISILTDEDKNLETIKDVVLNHPLFWTDKQRGYYMVRVVDWIKGKEEDQDKIKSYIVKGKVLPGTKDWRKHDRISVLLGYMNQQKLERKINVGQRLHVGNITEYENTALDYITFVRNALAHIVKVSDATRAFPQKIGSAQLIFDQVNGMTVTALNKIAENNGFHLYFSRWGLNHCPFEQVDSHSQT